MKKLYLSTLFLGITMVSFGQIVNIPDVNFKNRLVNTSCARLNSPAWMTDADTNNDGEIQLSEAQNVLELDVSTNEFNSSGDILSMQGIESFTNLTKLLCNGNNFNSLDLTMLSQLAELDCDKSHLATLNVAGLNQLQKLSCNFNSLASLDLSGLTNLTTLHCVTNNINSLNVADCSQLTYFDCSQNQISSLTFGSHPLMRSINASSNPITGIDTQSFPNVEWLDYSLTSIASINLDGMNSLLYLNLSSTLLSEIDCSQTAMQPQISCSDNPNLTSINVRNNQLPFYDPDLLNFPYSFENLPNLVSICMDDGEQNVLIYTNYNNNGNVQVVGGPDCNIPLEISTSGTNDFGLGNTISLYPNPAESTIKIDAASDVAIQSIAVYNPLGQLVKRWPLQNFNSSLPIDVSDLQSGTYLLEINSNKGKANRKFVKR